MGQEKHSKRVTEFHRYPYYTGYRSLDVSVDGYRNKPEWPLTPVESPFKLAITRAPARGYFLFGGNKIYQQADGPNTGPAYEMMNQPFNERLYAGVYAKFVSAARQGSAEWGMNIVQGRKALDTFIQLAKLSGTTIAAFVAVNQVGLEWLKRHPKATPRHVRKLRLRSDRQLRLAREKKERRRLARLTWTLDQVSSTLLAYRYGVLPLMIDMASTAEILSKEFEDAVHLRKAGTAPWPYPEGYENKAGVGMESVVLRATVKCHNPNLLLANRLGLINPQLWLWDATPWSFVVDWWFPIGSFLGNFTATVGLTLEDASITRTRSFTGEWRINTRYSRYPAVYESRLITGKRKERTLGSLPIPLSIPYGTGLGIQRGQNALALAAQLLKGKIK